MMTCRDCQAHLVGYLHNELSPHLRRRVAYHLDDCAACYGLYVQQRDLVRDLQNSVPLIGRDGAPRFDRVWASIQGELAQPRRAPLLFQARYGLAMLVMLLALLFPWALGGQRLTNAAPPTQPPPLLVMRTADITEPGPRGTAIALSVTVNDRAATPEANSRGVPEPGATAAPDNEGL